MVFEVQYFARLRDELGRSAETVESQAATPLELIDDLVRSDERARLLSEPFIRVIINDELAAIDSPIQPGDRIAFCPPFSGG